MDPGRGTSHFMAYVSGEEGRGRIALKVIPNIDNRVMDTANHHGTCISM